MPVFWDPFLVKSVLVGTEHCAMVIAAFSNAISKPVDVVVAENASIRGGYDGWFGRLDGRLPEMPISVSTTEIGWSAGIQKTTAKGFSGMPTADHFGPLWSTDRLDLV